MHINHYLCMCYYSTRKIPQHSSTRTWCQCKCSLLSFNSMSGYHVHDSSLLLKRNADGACEHRIHTRKLPYRNHSVLVSGIPRSVFQKRVYEHFSVSIPESDILSIAPILGGLRLVHPYRLHHRHDIADRHPSALISNRNHLLLLAHSQVIKIGHH